MISITIQYIVIAGLFGLAIWFFIKRFSKSNSSGGDAGCVKGCGSCSISAEPK